MSTFAGKMNVERCETRGTCAQAHVCKCEIEKMGKKLGDGLLCACTQLLLEAALRTIGLTHRR